MQNGNTYTITVNGVEDLAGNACADEALDVMFVVARYRCFPAKW
jgi:hypothetical protein